MANKPLKEFPVQRLQRESDKAWKAFKDYCELGENRELKSLHEHYARRKKNTATHRKPPTKSKDTLKGWSSNNDWAQRSSEYDAIQESRRLEILQAEEDAQWRSYAEGYRERNQRAGAASFELAILLITKSLTTLQKAELDVDQSIKALGGIAKMIETAQSTEGTALGVNQLLKELGN